jgi:hypothetical protein
VRIETIVMLVALCSDHREHGNRIMQESLLGQKNVDRIRPIVKTHEYRHRRDAHLVDVLFTRSLVKDGMALYQHSARCPSAVQWFLDENPRYAPFVPTKHDDGQKNDDDDDEELTEWTADLPRPSTTDRFTREQKRQINRFFRERAYLNHPINVHLDLYQAAIVAIRNGQS